MFPGSMRDENKLPLVKEATIRLLVEQLPEDRASHRSIRRYCRAGAALYPGTDKADTILNAIDRMEAGAPQRVAPAYNWPIRQPGNILSKVATIHPDDRRRFQCGRFQ